MQTLQIKCNSNKMSKPEPKRVALSTISQTATSSALSGAGAFTTGSTSLLRFGSEFLQDDDKNEKEEKNRNKTVRLELKLFQTDSSTYPEFNYSKLMFLEKKKQKKIKQKRASSDPFADNDDDVARIARELELKYGNAYSKGSKKDDHCDKGVGYDESDPFIDNTDAYDEVIPEEVETLEGGFYINCGALVFKNLKTDVPKTKTDEIIKMPNRNKKRIVSSSSEESSTSSSSSGDEEDDAEDESEDSGEDTAVENAKSKTGSVSSNSSAKNIKNNVAKVKLQQNGNKVKPFSLSSSSSNSPKPTTDEIGSDYEKERPLQKTVKTTTVKDMLKAKRDNFLKSQAGSDTNSLNGEVKGAVTKSSDDDSSRNSVNSDNNSQNAKKFNAEDKVNKLRSSDTKLPELDAEILKSIIEFRDSMKIKSINGKNFSMDEKHMTQFLKIDEFLIGVDKSKRNMVFAHLEYHLGLPKYYLQHTGKKMRVNEEKLKGLQTLKKLRKAIDYIMTNAIPSYESELRKYAESQVDDLNNDQPPNMPKKKFPFTSYIRNLIYECYEVRLASFSVLGVRNQTIEDFVNIYFKEKVVKLWPPGWMTQEELKKELDKVKTQKKATKKNSQSKSVNTMIQQIAEWPSTKHLEDLPTSSHSRANSDTESVASSVASNSLKRKNRDENKQSKNKAAKSNADKKNTGEYMTSNKNHMPITANVGLDPTYDQTLTSKRTDYNIYKTSLSSSSTATTTAISTMSKTLQTEKHSTGEITPHVINLDDFKSTKDILQTSKQLINTATYTNPIPSNTATLLNSSYTIDLDLKSNSSESDCVEVVEVFPPPKPTLPKSKSKKTKIENMHNFGVFGEVSNYMTSGNLNSNYINNNNNNNYNRKLQLPNATKIGNDFSGGVKQLTNVDVNQVVKALRDLEDEVSQKSKLSNPSQSTFARNK
ncbi:yemanuclein-like [Teleopsis dalmanni]|uniref:yemanuclein-like n=1 Tax=Teleopsis dalmanni TaxID=139649 RepID=UPI0018CE0A93|nr:yemanuclein-like [Teleopsis dalmanni]